jgi:hypothetical protein
MSDQAENTSRFAADEGTPETILRLMDNMDFYQTQKAIARDSGDAEKMKKAKLGFAMAFARLVRCAARVDA